MPNKDLLRKFAKLAVNTGANVQEGQVVAVNASPETRELARLIVEEAYNAGAKRVRVNWSDAYIGRLHYHGMTIEEARQVLGEFLRNARHNRHLCVRIIHGKGRGSKHGPVLKQQVFRWLQRWDEVLALCSARPVDGGTGAIYVLLREKR